MKRIIIFSIALCCFSFGLLKAQNKKTKASKGTTQKQTAKSDSPRPKYKFKASPVFLGNSDLRDGAISKKMFDSLILDGLTATDSAGIKASVLQFAFYYKERNLYEDSVGNYYVGTELLTDFSKSNKLNTYMLNSLLERTKKGDTAFFDDILVRLPDSLIIQGIPMKFVIEK
jgi:hypothetical protein